MRRIMQAVKSTIKLLLLGTVVLALAAVLAVWLAFADRPEVVRDSVMTPADVARLRELVSASDPRKRAQGAKAVQTFRAGARDLDLTLNDAVRRLLHGASLVTLEAGRARVQASVKVPRLPPGLGPWVNVDARLRETPGLPEIDSLHLGAVPVPAWLARWTLMKALEHYQATGQVQSVRDMVQRVRIEPAEVVVDYVWRPDALRAAIVPPDDQRRLKAYIEALVPLVAKGPDKVALATLLPPMFELARNRSVALGGSPPDMVQENRAALVALALYATGQSPAQLVQAARDWKLPAVHPVVVRGREDFAMHFLVSAVLASEGGGRLADAIGVYKEISDTRGGSGFSFNDIAADRAGTRFGQLAVGNPAALQDAVAQGTVEDDFMPDVTDLPEFLSEDQFKATYGRVGAPAYDRMLADIEQRVRARRLLR